MQTPREIIKILAIGIKGRLFLFKDYFTIIKIMQIIIAIMVRATTIIILIVIGNIIL